MKLRLNRNIKYTLILGILIFLGGLIGQRFEFGYLHAADPIVMMGAVILPLPYALGAALVSCLAADWIKDPEITVFIATVICKTLMVCLVKLLLKKPAVREAADLYLAPVALLPIPIHYLISAIERLVLGEGATAFLNATATLRKDAIQGLGSLLLFAIFYSIGKKWRARRKAQKDSK